jgi:HPt (histidine-containing phosphotransfer) domain-containing protein
MSADEIDELFQELRREYLSESKDRLAELRAGLGAFRGGTPEAAASLKTHFHRLAGSGGSYGFPEISVIAKEAELWIATGPPPGRAAVARLEETIERLEAAFKGGEK